jgi:hypothetical protein
MTMRIADLGSAIEIMAGRSASPSYGMTRALSDTLEALREDLGHLPLGNPAPWERKGPCEHIPFQPLPQRSVKRFRRFLGRRRDWLIEFWSNRVWWISGRVWARHWPPCSDCGWDGSVGMLVEPEQPDEATQAD